MKQPNIFEFWGKNIYLNFPHPIAPLLGETDVCDQWLFCTKFNAQQLLFETFIDIMRIFGSVETLIKSTFFPQNNIISIYRGTKLHSRGEIDVCAQWIFCIKVNSEQLLLEQFFDIIGNFDSVQPKSESTFPLQGYIILETYQSFGHRSSNHGGDRYVHPLHFLYKL